MRGRGCRAEAASPTHILSRLCSSLLLLPWPASVTSPPPPRPYRPHTLLAADPLPRRATAHCRRCAFTGSVPSSQTSTAVVRLYTTWAVGPWVIFIDTSTAPSAACFYHLRRPIGRPRVHVCPNPKLPPSSPPYDTRSVASDAPTLSTHLPKMKGRMIRCPPSPSSFYCNGCMTATLLLLLLSTDV